MGNSSHQHALSKVCVSRLISKKIHSTFHERTDRVGKHSELTKQLLESCAAATRRAWLNQWLSPGVRIRACKALRTWLWRQWKEVFSVHQEVKGCCGCTRVIWIQGVAAQEQSKPSRLRISSRWSVYVLWERGVGWVLINSQSKIPSFFFVLFCVSKKVFVFSFCQKCINSQPFPMENLAFVVQIPDPSHHSVTVRTYWKVRFPSHLLWALNKFLIVNDQSNYILHAL